MNTQNDKVNATHPDYDKGVILRETFEDVMNGTAAMRAAGAKHLPKFPAETDESYDLRVKTATLQNITAKTVGSFCGLVFQKDITLGDDVPATIKTLWENIDNQGTHGNVFARDAFEDSFDGWCVILVDSPTARASDLGEQKALGLRPYWVEYDACNVINWDYQINPVSKKRELSLIVLREYITKRVGNFVRETVEQYRVFRLENGVTWELWEKVKDHNGKEDYVQIDGGTIEKQTSIPVAIIGELGDEPPLMDLAYKNVEHYQDYSDYKSLKHKTAVPLFYTVNLDGEPAAIGGDVWFKCNEGGSIGWATTDPNALPHHVDGLENIKKEMGQLGLAMMAGKPTQGDVTATETMLDSVQETSSLQVRATQLKDAIENALQFTANYMGEKNGGTIELGATWSSMVLSTQELQTMITAYESGVISLESVVYMLKKTDKLPPDTTVEDEIAAIKKETREMTPVMNAMRMPNENQKTQEEASGGFRPNGGV